ncbi:hypothetical protein O988_09170 [Pseudogymnoascus sp. VKM F-3808]|nr:hypothetical protein O988_09170 [Pseudogymnoascus sp. VKM F-3808]
MDSKEEPPSKRHKMALKLPFIKMLPLEIRTEIYRLVVLPPGTKREKRIFKTVSSDSTINPLDSVQHFYIAHIDYKDKITVFTEGIVGVPELAEDVLSLVLPQTLFKFTSTIPLVKFTEAVNAYANNLKSVPELNVEINYMNMTNSKCHRTLGSWEPIELPHGLNIDFVGDVSDWFMKTGLLPKTTTLHLDVTHVWRDFRLLRLLGILSGISKMEVKFQFPAPPIPRQDYGFFIAQTITAVKDIEIPEQLGISDARREELVKIGCTGFERPRRSSRKTGER